MLIHDITNGDVNQTVGQQCMMWGVTCSGPDEQGMPKVVLFGNIRIIKYNTVEYNHSHTNNCTATYPRYALHSVLCHLHTTTFVQPFKCQGYLMTRWSWPLIYDLEDLISLYIHYSCVTWKNVCDISIHSCEIGKIISSYMICHLVFISGVKIETIMYRTWFLKIESFVSYIIIKEV